MERKPIIAGITQGDINGIGYEIIIKALADSSDHRSLRACCLRLAQGGGIPSQGA
ncbi:MAG: hypothetical protein MZV63_42675 [Marinilabiliales bacterium]|nr:hypothetical protein [Marinilabiliales bacterium]